ncbi:tryptophan synthase, alpha subunit [Alkaliphilus metalliredigens QYMF]|uniref:Tryptophan synthase alpha chain n=1 Tax=Alkaliphilus metalliredigens (strain QYMF) TaxID=293826 RepID=TRPA_ALKMQ|nr:tryptophan synthase subunit alpha [Alkaliphilus metalliredigens]A6TM77.1 RecName: Full=Tryptophan synthase alpha chain [Alkaliphilus metalliredigens QYMF]ABR47295.1 tryptophan synthase, alpha subunit [Alkaliphilus metalliredigens QYMF]
MISRITNKLQALKEYDEKALITYVTAGDPDLETTFDLVLAMEKAGADIIELGIPYSDPLADGPVIQRASQRALNAGANMEAIFELVIKLREKTQIPLVFLVYYNCVFKYGLETFLNRCQEIGIDGLIIPDLPLEERRELQVMMQQYPMDLIPLVAPTSEDRMKEIVQDAEGFIYCVSSTGVTGKRNSLAGNLEGFMQQLRTYTEIPLVIGFGISNSEMMDKLKNICDGFIIGSAVIEKIEAGLEDRSSVERVSKFIEKLYEFKNLG